MNFRRAVVVLLPCSISLLSILSISSDASADSIKSCNGIALAGTVMDPEIGDPAAVIEYASSNEQRVIFINEAIQPGCTLIRVQSNQINVRSGDETFSLSLGVNVLSEMPRDSGEETVSLAKVSNIDPSRLSERWTSFTRTLEGTLKNKRRTFSDGAFKGSAFIEFKPEGDLKKIGLQRRDVVTEINSIPLLKWRQQVDAVTLSNNSSFSITVNREGRLITLHVTQ